MRKLHIVLFLLGLTVQLYGQTPVDFVSQVVPLFSSCTSSSCHGSSGQGGLTLTGTPVAIYNEVVNEVGPSGTTRVNTSIPASSLILTNPSPSSNELHPFKPSTWLAGQPAYNTVLTWIQEGAILTTIDEDPTPIVPTEFALRQNYPNPFNPTTTIQYNIPRASRVELSIYNMLGQKFRTLVNENQAPGFYALEWDGKNDAGEPAFSGVYLYQLKTGELGQTQKMVLLK